MEYDLFKTLVTERIKEYMPQVFRTYKVDVRPVRKVNQKKDAFCLIPPGPTKNLAIPTLYLDDLYLDFMEDEDLDRVLQQAAGVFITWSGYEVPELCEIRLEDHRDHIIANLISRRRNQELLETIRRFDAVVCGCDTVAMGVMRALVDGGVRIPEDIRVIGYDGIEFAKYTVVPLSTIAQPFYQIGSTGAQVLLDRIREPDGPARKIMYEGELVIRRSTE